MSASPNVAIVGVGVGVPALRLAAADVAAGWGRKGGRGRVAVCGPDEDTLTLAWTAVDGALAATGVAPEDVDGLWWGTARPPFAEGPSWSHLAATLRLGPTVTGGLSSGSGHAGIEALLAAIDAVAAGRVHRAVVVASDALVPGAGSGLEPVCGAGAAALVLTAGDGPARIGPVISRWQAALDRYRGDRESATREAYDGRLFREEVFLPLLSACAAELDMPDDTRWSLPDPDGRLGAALARKLGATRVSSADGRVALGDLGAAAALVGLVPALAAPGPAATVAYGGGRVTALSVGVPAEVPGAATAVAALAAEGTAAAYTDMLRSRGQLVPAGEQVEMAVPPGSAMFVRGNTENLGLLGARCVECATVSFPPSIHPSCTNCGADKFDTLPLARAGTVQTFVVNHTMPAPFVAPLPLVCVDLDDGARVMLQGTSRSTGVEIGDRVALVLRRYTVERGVPVYGWKVDLHP